MLARRCCCLLIGLCLLLAVCPSAPADSPAATRLQIATFRCDITPPLGCVIYGQAAKTIEQPLWAKGLVLQDGQDRYVLCALDWRSLVAEENGQLRTALADAVGTTADRVAVQCVHQHTAPSGGEAGEELLDAVADRLATAASAAVDELEDCDRIGHGQAVVERVASTRRIPTDDGKVITRFTSTKGRPELRELPEGMIDPRLKTVTFASGDRPLVRLHYYATHPQSFYRDHRVSVDFPGLARDRIEREEGVFQIYFTGCGGDIGAGKYNDGTPAARDQLTDRLARGMRDAIAATEFTPLGPLRWRSLELNLPALSDPQQVVGPIALSGFHVGSVSVLHLPGEPMVEFQLFAQETAPGRFVAVAGYGNGSPGYICTAAAFAQGGYEPSASRVGPESEQHLKQGIRQLMGTDQNWANWRGPRQDGSSGLQDLPTAWSRDAGIAWTCELPEWGNSTPIVWEDAVFVTSHVEDRDLCLLRIDRDSGQVVWTRTVGSAAAPRVNPGLSRDESRRHTKFHNTQNLASPSCVTDGQVVIAHFGNGDLAAYDFDGRQLWKRNLQDDHGPYTIWWGHANSPVLFDDLVISICMQDSCRDLPGDESPSYLVAHHRRTGEQVWFVPRPTQAEAESCDAYTTPIFRRRAATTEMIVWGGQVLDAYEPSSGKRLWWMTGLGGNRVIPSPILSDEMVYVTQGMREPMLAVRCDAEGARSERDILWTFDSNTSDSPSPVISDDLLFYTSNNGIASCLDRRSGELVWRERLPGQYRASPLLAGGHVYFLNTDGLTTVVQAAREFHPVAENALNTETFASPSAAAGRLYIRGRDRLFCIQR
jgi:outer membrane protein assembly factor BamB